MTGGVFMNLTPHGHVGDVPPNADLVAEPLYDPPEIMTEEETARFLRVPRSKLTYWRQRCVLTYMRHWGNDSRAAYTFMLDNVREWRKRRDKKEAGTRGIKKCRKS